MCTRKALESAALADFLGELVDFRIPIDEAVACFREPAVLVHIACKPILTAVVKNGSKLRNYKRNCYNGLLSTAIQ